MTMNELDKIYVKINRKYTEEQIFSAEQQVPIPSHTDISYFIACCAFASVNSRTVKILNNTLKKLKSIEIGMGADIDFENERMTVISECNIAIRKNVNLASEMRKLQYHAVTMNANDIKEITNPNKLIMIYGQFFEMKNLSIEYLNEALDIQKRIEEISGVNKIIEP